MADKVTAPKIRSSKGERIVCVTAYDTPTAEIADAGGVDIILVGDSVGNVVLGYENTLPVTLEDMLHHVRAVSRGVKHALIVADMPFGSYQTSPESATQAAIALVKSGAEAVKLEGPYEEAITAIVKAGIPVMGHVGMTPQSVHQYGGFRVQGRGNKAEIVVDAAKKVQNSGAFSIVLELIPSVVAERITSDLTIPTIGIGAGPHCDGEVQVFHDITGLTKGEPLKHTKRFLNARDLFIEAIGNYAADVRNRVFPSDENGF